MKVHSAEWYDTVVERADQFARKNGLDGLDRDKLRDFALRIAKWQYNEGAVAMEKFLKKKNK